MELRVHSIHFDADRKLLEVISKKVDKLTTFNDKLMSGEVFLRLDKADDHSNKVAEIKINSWYRVVCKVNVLRLKKQQT